MWISVSHLRPNQCLLAATCLQSQSHKDSKTLCTRLTMACQMVHNDSALAWGTWGACAGHNIAAGVHTRWRPHLVQQVAPPGCPYALRMQPALPQCIPERGLRKFVAWPGQHMVQRAAQALLTRPAHGSCIFDVNRATCRLQARACTGAYRS